MSRRGFENTSARRRWVGGWGGAQRTCDPRGSRRRGFHVRARLPGRAATGYPLHDTFVRAYAQEFEKLERLSKQVESGQLTLRVAEVYPPERGAEAHRRLEAGGTRGRLVIQF